MALPRLKHFGWGREGEGLTADETVLVLGRIQARFGPAAEREVKPPPLEDIKLEPPRLKVPASLPFCTTAHYDRAAHAHGKSYPEYVRGLLGDYSSAPDVVAYPRTEADVAAVLDWASGAQASVTPFGGGSSVAGGIEPDGGRCTQAAWSSIVQHMNRVVEIDRHPRRAHPGRRARAGDRGAAPPARADAAALPAELPDLDTGRLDRHPQRRALRLALHAHRRLRGIDDDGDAGGRIETRRLPGSGAGPLSGSDDHRLGGHTGRHREAWMRLQDRPTPRRRPASASPRWARRPAAVRALTQADFTPATAACSTRPKRSATAWATGPRRSWC